MKSTTGPPADVTYDGVNDYAYDGEGRLCAMQYVTGIGSPGPVVGYIYDAEGTRVAKGTLTSWSCNPATNGFTATASYVLGLGGEEVTEMTVTGNPTSGYTSTWKHTNVFGGGKLVATYSGTDTYFAFTDWLGTKRAEYTPDGTSALYSSLPYGDGLSSTGSAADATEHHFTGKERDQESNNDFFGARYYMSSMGRFMSPDPHDPILIRQGSISGGIPLEAADSSFLGFAENPQNWNKYAYVRNNPLGLTDPTGGFPASGDGHHLLVERGSISNPLARDFANSIKTGGPNPPSNNWSIESGHPAYNNAVNEIESELEQTEGDSNAWSLDQWKAFATRVLNSDEPAIKNFLDQIERELPGSRAKLAAAIAAYRPTAAVIARTYAWAAAAAALTRLQSTASELLVCVTATCKESVTHKFIFGPQPTI